MPSSWLGIVPTNQVKPAKPLILRHLQHSATVVTMFASANALTCIRTCCFGFCVFHGFEITPFP